MRPVALVLCLAASAAFAQSPAWQSLSDRVLSDFEQAIAEERVIPFVAPYEHPDMLAASAAYLNLTPEAYRSKVAAGYHYSTEISEITSFRWGEFSTGTQPMDWTIASYETVIGIEGRAPTVSCVRLLVFGDVERHYLTVLGSELSEALFVKAVPEMAEVVQAQAADC